MYSSKKIKLPKSIKEIKTSKPVIDLSIRKTKTPKNIIRSAILFWILKIKIKKIHNSETKYFFSISDIREITVKNIIRTSLKETEL